MYFDKPGKINTAKTLNLAFERGKALGIEVNRKKVQWSLSQGGTSKGADSALVLTPANQSDLFSMRIRKIVCKPRTF